MLDSLSINISGSYHKLVSALNAFGRRSTGLAMGTGRGVVGLGRSIKNLPNVKIPLSIDVGNKDARAKIKQISDDIDKLKEKRAALQATTFKGKGKVAKELARDTEVKEINKQIIGLAKHRKSLADGIKSNQAFSESMEALSNNLAKGARMAFFAAAAMTTFGMAITNASKSVLSSFQKVEEATLKIEFSLMSLNKEANFAVVKEQITALSNQYGRSATEISEASLRIIRSGFSDVTVHQKILESSVRIARLTFTDTANAAENYVKVLKAVQAIGGNAATSEEALNDVTEKWMNNLIVLSQQTNSSLDDLVAGFSHVASSVTGFGFSADETMAALGALTETGMSASVAGRRMQSAFSTLVQVSDQWGIQIKDTDGNMKDMEGMLEALQQAMKDMGIESQKSEFLLHLFGTEGQTVIEGLLQAYDSGRIGEVNRAMQDHSKLIVEEEKLTDSYTESMNKLAAAWENFKIKVGEVLATLITPWITKVSTLITEHGDLIAKNEALIISFAGIGAALTVLGPAVGAFAGILQIAAMLVGTVGSLVGLLSSEGALSTGLTTIAAKLGILQVTGETMAVSLEGIAGILIWIGIIIGGIIGFFESITNILDMHESKLFGAAGAMKKVADAGKLLGQFLVPILSILGSIFNMVLNTGKAVGGLIAFVATMIVGLLDWLGMLDPIIDIFKQLLDIANGLAQIFKLMEIATKAMAITFSGSADSLEQLGQLSVEFFNTFKGLDQIIRSVVDIVKDLLMVVLFPIANLFVAAMDGIKAVIDGALGLLDSIISAIPALTVELIDIAVDMGIAFAAAVIEGIAAEIGNLIPV